MASIDTSVHSIPAARSVDRLKPVRIWLYAIAALVLLMVIVGGVTRLTDSGLSITSWKPISGTIPPLSDADWQAEFDAYKQIPEYQIQNHWMNVDEFKSIFWWEWSHRFLGRFIGFAFAVPFVVFLLQRRFSWRMAAPLAGLFVLGGLQGALGWWMVSSGLTERVDVSQYRLAAHLSAAAVLFIALIGFARWLEPKRDASRAGSGEIGFAVALLLLIFVQLVAGAFVAGLDAGMGYNTWPLMNGALIPSGLGTIDPWWRNLFENTLTVQFVHRCIAYVIVLYAGFMVWRQGRAGGFGGVHAWVVLLGVMVLAQVGLGISTLLSVVQIDLASAHQAMAFLLLGATAAYVIDLMRSRGNIIPHS